jgi:hypothetical protein
VLDPTTLKFIKAIKLSFPENSSHDFYKIYHLNGYYHGHLMAYGVVFVN